MMRALWTAASGMQAQQMTVDVISNNLANVNTTSFKKERVEFKDLLYETLDRARLLSGQSSSQANAGQTNNNQTGVSQTGSQAKPVNLQVGLGTTPVATVRDFSPGSPEETGNPLDFYIDGEGFFMIQGPKGNTDYTRDGSFKISLTDQGEMLTTSEGYPVLDDTGNPIVFSQDASGLSNLKVSQAGDISYIDSTGATIPTGQKIGVVKFINTNALENIGNNLYSSNDEAGTPTANADMGTKSLINQNFLESSNVETVEEMVKLIVAQRAYELNSKAIQSSDDMLGMANNLRR